VPGFGVVNYDDDVYLGARGLEHGLSARNVAWAFTTFHHSNWHPLTWLSWFAEVELFGLRAGPMHLCNALLHAANGALAYAALLLLTRKALPSALAAALFVVHPMHVESVAWISERKDVLSMFFGLWTLIAWARYARRPGPAAYLGVVAAFALALLSKPMLVTLPFVLLLLDYWPLGRHRAQRWSRLALEKAPLFAMSAASCVITWLAQSSGGAMRTAGRFPLELRLANAADATVSYLLKTLFPVNLAVLYPPSLQGPNLLVSALAAGVIALISWNAWVQRERLPFCLVGWAWFLGALAPVIGIVQVGEQAMADRYAYWPHVGLFVAIAFWVNAVAFEAQPRRRRIIASAACAVCLGVLGLLAWRQTHVWKDSETLWRHALAVTEDNYVAHANLSRALLGSNPEEARRHAELALALAPEAFEAAGDPAAGSRSDR
jgi:hypothetical protein